MFKRTIKRISVAAVILCLVVALIPVGSFAVADVALAGAAVATLADAYGMSYGINSSYSVSSSAGVGDSFTELWDDFNEYQTNNNLSTYDILDVYESMQSEGFIDKHSHSSGNFAGFYVDAESAEILDRFWNWLLSGPANMIIVDNQYFEWSVDQNGSVQPISIINVSTINGAAVGLFPLTIQTSQSNSTAFSSDGDAYYFWYRASGDTINHFVSFSLDSNVHRYRSFNNGTPTTETNNNLDNKVYYSNRSYSASEYYVADPVFVTSQTNDTFVIREYLNLDSSASPSYSEDSVSVDPYVGVENPTLPVVSDPNYVPLAREITTNVPWDDDEYGDVFPLPVPEFEKLVEDSVSKIQDGTFELEEVEEDNPPAPPSEVFLPFLPVGLPSFNFSFSGIWHYVREWVASLGDFLSMVFSTWSILPYAMVVPVFATAVVVIVLGVYKRFFM